MQRSHDGIAWRAIRRFGRTALGIVGYQPTEWWALAWVCVFRKALVSGINWSRKGSGYLRELTYSSLPRSSLYLSLSIHLVVSVSLARRLVGLRVQGNIGTRLYQSMSHSPPSPLHGSSCIASYTRLRSGQRYNPMARSLWLLSAFLIPEYLSTARINLVFLPTTPLFGRVHLIRSRVRRFIHEWHDATRRGDKFLPRSDGQRFRWLAWNLTIELDQLINVYRLAGRPFDHAFSSSSVARRCGEICHRCAKRWKVLSIAFWNRVLVYDKEAQLLA